MVIYINVNVCWVVNFGLYKIKIKNVIDFLFVFLLIFFIYFEKIWVRRVDDVWERDCDLNKLIWNNILDL